MAGILGKTSIETLRRSSLPCNNTGEIHSDVNNTIESLPEFCSRKPIDLFAIGIYLVHLENIENESYSSDRYRLKMRN